MDINRLLENFLGQASKGGSASMPDASRQAGAQGLGQGQGLGQLGGIADRLSQGLGSGLGQLPGGLTGGAAAGGLIALLLGSKTARKIGGKALTYGGLAVVGTLAYKAWQDYKANRPATGTEPANIPQLPAPPQDSGFALDQPAGNGADMRLALMQAMIAAAKADGHIDAAENRVIRSQIDALGLAADEKAFLFDALDAPSDPIAIACLASGEEQGAELYLASLIAIDVDTREEQRYLERLGDALRLPDALRGQLEAQARQLKAAV